MQKLLIIDDNPEILDSLDFLFKSYNFSTCLISDGRDVLEAIESFEPQLIILDIKIGDHDGRQICRQLSTNIFTKHIPIILFSAMNVTSESLLDTGMADFIMKPFEIDLLMSKVNKHVIKLPDPVEIKQKLDQILVDILGINAGECKNEARIMKDLGANKRDLILIFGTCEHVFRTKKIKPYLKDCATVGDMVEAIILCLFPNTNKYKTQIKVPKSLNLWDSGILNLKKKIRSTFQ